MDLPRYRDLTRRLLSTIEADPHVIGLVALGSMAEIARLPDAWSDHDFFVITVPGVQEDFRQNLDWLPDADQIVLRIRETAHGLKVLYADGHLLEFAIFDEAELPIASANDYRVLLDRGPVSEIMQSIAARSRPSADSAPYDPVHDFSMVLCLLLVGAGRYARGEHLSAHMFIKSHALQRLLALLAHLLTSDNASRLDSLDPFRRFEIVFPHAGADINRALLLPPLKSARALLDLAVEAAGPALPDYPAEAVQTVREYLAQVEETR